MRHNDTIIFHGSDANIQYVHWLEYHSLLPNFKIEKVVGELNMITVYFSYTTEV